MHDSCNLYPVMLLPWAGATMSWSQGSVGLFGEGSSSMQGGTSSSSGLRPLLTTRVSASDSMLSTAVQIEGACFLCDTAAALTEVGVASWARFQWQVVHTYAYFRKLYR